MLPAIVGTAIEYYDVALYGYMAPVLTKVFFSFVPNHSAYIYYFSFEIIAALFQLLGSYILGRIGDSKGRKQVMYYSMFGTFSITFFISFIPTYNDIGIYAAILFVMARAIQSFFLGGEYNGGAIYCFEHTRRANRFGFISGIYGAVAVFGVLLAAIVSTIIMHLGFEFFRIAYMLSVVFAMFTYRMRKQLVETPEYLQVQQKPTNLQQLNLNKSIFLAIALVSLLSGVLYGFPTRIFNAIIPMATNIQEKDIMLINSVTLIPYMFFLVLFGFLADYVTPAKVMYGAILGIVLLIIPIMMLIAHNQSMLNIILVKLVFMLLAAGLIGPFHAWTQTISKPENRCTQISTAYSFGKLGAIALLPITILIFDKAKNLVLASLVLVVLAIIVSLIIRKNFIGN